ncbi:DUF2550 domain-containing protein [Neomicrococcus aestuarii]|uniref:DUF2550 domain-containing protein n=1 Tax=Neomicrococcus aestuarii TaxID=556325 RepID=A0A1L2ZLH9_9MICC|nr:DUF2550 domain-containing protein [Neomicrococcus aestuarii]APF39872.1 hypothetical protein BHE16_01245 [Neomicrococcus aestuarii]
MGDLGIVFAVLAGALLLVFLFLGAMAVRRFQLRRELGTFDASLSTRPGHWTMGICRYQEDSLEFLRLFSVSWVPAKTYVRSDLTILGWREPGEFERARLLPGSVVVQLQFRGEDFNVAMKYGAYNGLSAWIEAGPAVGVGIWR